MISFYKCLTESSGTFTAFPMITIQGLTAVEKHSIPPEYFVLNSENGLAHISTTGSLTDGNKELGSRNMT